MTIQQGHRYAWGAYDAIALESGSGCVQIAVIDHDLPYPLRAPLVGACQPAQAGGYALFRKQGPSMSSVLIGVFWLIGAAFVSVFESHRYTYALRLVCGVVGCVLWALSLVLCAAMTWRAIHG